MDLIGLPWGASAGSSESENSETDSECCSHQNRRLFIWIVKNFFSSIDPGRQFAIDLIFARVALSAGADSTGEKASHQFVYTAQARPGGFF